MLNPPSSRKDNALSTGDKSCIATQITSSTQWGTKGPKTLNIKIPNN